MLTINVWIMALLMFMSACVGALLVCIVWSMVEYARVEREYDEMEIAAMLRNNKEER